MKKKIIFEYKNKKINLEVENCNFLKKFTGLMFCLREKAKALLFDFKKPVKVRIHSFFVFFPFVAVWLDDENKVIELKLVKSFKPSICPNKSFCKLIEIPVNKKYKEIIELLVED